MTYERTPEHRATMSEALKGKRHTYRSASTNPEVAAKIASWWTPERREAKRQEMLARNPNARYHGLSHKGTKRMKAGRVCQHCQHDGSESRLDIHHIDRNKRNQEASNLLVLCHRCHMQEHARAGETGFDRMHQRRRSKTSRDSASTSRSA
jgi:5-methylcytosine-specific restriction endonuclease McrA